MKAEQDLLTDNREFAPRNFLPLAGAMPAGRAKRPAGFFILRERKERRQSDKERKVLTNRRKCKQKKITEEAEEGKKKMGQANYDRIVFEVS